MKQTSVMDGVLHCSRYSFGPNRLHYCGPDANREMLAHLRANQGDSGLTHLLSQFNTLFPYLRHIAQANHIQDPFDDRVVEAYWIGNDLLEKANKGKFYYHLLDEHGIKKRIGAREFDRVADKIRQGAVPHHSFHVLNIWRRTGHHDIAHTLESLDSCRISWGKVEEINGPFITVQSEPLLYSGGRLVLGDSVSKRITRQLESYFDIEQIKIGDTVTFHWGVPCEVITPRQAALLKKYTLLSLKLANQTI